MMIASIGLVMIGAEDTEAASASVPSVGSGGSYHDFLYANYPGADPEYYQAADVEEGIAYITWDKRELGYVMTDKGWSWDGHYVVNLNTKPDGSGRSFGIDESEIVLAQDVPSIADADNNIKLYLMWAEVGVVTEDQSLDEKDTGLLLAVGFTTALAVLMLVSYVFVKKK